MFTKCQTPSNRRTDGRTDAVNRIWCIFPFWHLMAIILMNLPIINLPNFVHLLVDPGYYFPLDFYKASRFVLPIGWTPVTTQRTKRQTNERKDEGTGGRTKGQSVRTSLKLSLTRINVLVIKMSWRKWISFTYLFFSATTPTFRVCWHYEARFNNSTNSL